VKWLAKKKFVGPLVLPPTQTDSERKKKGQFCFHDLTQTNQNGHASGR
jgi:hypothetical protein